VPSSTLALIDKQAPNFLGQYHDKQFGSREHFEANGKDELMQERFVPWHTKLLRLVRKKKTNNKNEFGGGGGSKSK